MDRKIRKIQEEFNDDELNLGRHQKKLHYLKTRRKVRKLEILLSRARIFARLLMIVLIIWLLVKTACLPQWYLNKDIFSYYPGKYLKFEGNEIVSNRQIMEQLNQVKLPHKPIYLINTELVEKSILKLSPIKKVYIRRFWFPARLKITISEKVPILSVSPSPKIMPVAVFTKEKTIIGREFLPLPYSKNVYSVITYDNFYKWTPQHISYIEKLSKRIESLSKERLQYLDIRNPDDVFAQLDNVRLRLGELNMTIFKRSERIGSILNEALKIKDDIDYIDLRWEGQTSIKLKNKKTSNPVELAKEMKLNIP
ncbi:MAG: FtsQ-type POTRA domain-containing protein [bacterium]